MTDSTIIRTGGRPASTASTGRPSSRPSSRPAGRTTGRTPVRTRLRRRWIVALLAVVAWAASHATTGRDVVNVGGWPSFQRFWTSITRPELAADFLRLTLDATLTTAAFALLGTVVSIVIGLVGAPIVAERLTESTDHRRVAVAARHAVRSLARLAFVVPRAVHEVIWALLVIQVLGFDPLVAVLAIAIQFGAVTAKVYGEFVDEADPRAYRAMRAGGTGRLVSLLYGIVPAIRRDLVSYGFYRLECAVRAAAVLGIIGAAGLGFQLDLSFETLRYGEVWTLIVALMILSGLTDALSSAVRRSDAPAAIGRLWLAVLVAVPFAAWHVGLDPRTLWSERTRRLARDLVADLLPPRLGPGGWSELVSATIDTAAMSVLGTVVAVGGGLFAGVIAARSGPSSGDGAARAAVGWTTRLVLLLCRAVPSPVWAFLVVLVMFPGIWPGAIALGIYNGGVLGRLFAEVIEDHDDRARRHLRAGGADVVQQHLYGVLPSVAPRLLALALYRWEVITRETVVVGVVGAAGLGRLIQEHLVARDFAAVVGAVGGLVVLTAVIDVVSSRIRAALR